MNITPSDLQTTFIIKTFERPERLFLLLKSLDKFYPNVPIIIIDDSRKPIKKKWAPHIQYIYTEFDIGVSEGRNRAVKLVKTKYFVLLDDDYEFTEQTKIEIFKELLEKYNFDLIAGRYRDFYWSDGTFRAEDNFEGFLRTYRKVIYICIYDDIADDCDAIPVDYTRNLFLAKTDVIQKNPWNSKIKTEEHISFFIDLQNNNVKVGYTPYVIANHWLDHGKNEDGEITNQTYYEHRVVRRDRNTELWCEEYNLKTYHILHFNRFYSTNKYKSFYQKPYLFFVQFMTIRFAHLFVFIKSIIKALIKHTLNARYKCLMKICEILSIDYDRLKENYFKLKMKFLKNTRYKCLTKMCKILSIDYDRLKGFYWKLRMKLVKN